MKGASGMGKMEGSQKTILLDCGKGVLSGGIVALGVCLGVLIVEALILSHGMVSMDGLYQMTLIGCAVGAFVGGRWAISQCCGRALFVGLLVGVVLMLFCVTIGVVLFQGHPSSGGTGLFLACLCGGAIASFWRRKGKGKGKKKRRK